jgi:Phosphate/sulphate permeases
MIYPSLTIIALISDGVLVINLHTLLLVISSWIFSPIISILLTISLYFLIRRYIDRIENSLIKVIKFYRLIILASCSFIVFVLGANTIGLLVSLGLVSFPHNIVELTYAVGASLGTFTLSKRAAIKVGFKITKLGYTSSSSVMLGSFLTSEVFTLMGIPISLTQITMGGIIGLSLLNMSNKSTSSNVRNVIKNWTMAPLLCMMGSLVAFESTSALVFLHAL